MDKGGPDSFASHRAKKREEPTTVIPRRMEPAQYDVVVIGSSPLLILEALSRRRDGQTVAIVEESEALGGAWKVDHYIHGTEEILHECACHLIEWQAGGYEFLETLSDYPFDVLEPQPVRIREKKQKISPYTSRRGLARNYLRCWLSMAYALVRLPLGWLGVAEISAREAAARFRRSIFHLAEETTLRLSGVLKFDAVRAPRGGYSRYISHLKDQIRRHGIGIVLGRAEGLCRDHHRIQVRLSDGRTMSATEIVVGESTMISSIDGVPRNPAKLSEYYHVLIGIPASAVKIRNSYVHFADNKIFHRLTYVDDAVLEEGRMTSIFLLQIRCKLEEVHDLGKKLAMALALYPIATSLNGLRIMKHMTGRYLASAEDSAWGNFSDPRIKIIKTIGDLSKNAMRRRLNLSSWQNSAGKFSL